MATGNPIPQTLREQDLSGKVAVITGASKGIGRATAINLALRGCSILGTCSGPATEHHINSLNDEVATIYKAANKPYKSKIVGLSADIFAPSCAQIISSAVSEHFDDQVNIFVNNACDPVPGVIGEMMVEDIQRSLVANIQTPVLIVDEFTRRQFFRPESRIIYISSVRSRLPWSMQLMYAAGKSAGESLCRTWAEAFGGKEGRFSFMAGTTANAVSVGLTQTDSVMSCPEEMIENFKNEFIPKQNIPRFAQPDDVADVIGMLCSRDARWITGSVVCANGGSVNIG